MTQFEDVLETILEEYARRDSEGEFDTWEETDAFVKEKTEVLLAYVKEEPVSEELEEAGKQYLERSNPDRVHQITNAFKAGAKWHKEQMLAKSIEGIARPDDNEIWCDLKSFNFKDGNKVKVIVIKEV